MLNLIPALILLFVNGPTAPLADNALLGSSVSVQRPIGPDAQTALLQLALSHLQSERQARRPSVAPDGHRSACLVESLPDAVGPKLLTGFQTPGRTRDGPSYA